MMKRRRAGTVVLIAFAAVTACRRGRELPVRGTPCTSDPDCAPTYICARTRLVCEWPGDLAATDAAVDEAAARLPDSSDASAPQPEVVAGDTRDAWADEEAVAPVLAPGELPGLAFWFDAAVGVTLQPDGQRVSVWEDRSPRKHAARAGRLGPVFSRDAEHGHPALSFGLVGGETVALHIPDHESLRWNSDDFTLGVVLRHRNHAGNEKDPVSYGLIYAKVEAELAPYLGPQLYANDPWPSYLGIGPTRTGFRFQLVSFQDRGVGSQTDGYDDGNVHLVLALRRRELLVLRIDGELVASHVAPAIDDVGTPGTDGVIGASPTRLAQQLEGEIFELFAYAGSTPEEQVEALERFLLDKYRIAPASRDR
jgi:hypothetical protein